MPYNRELSPHICCLFFFFFQAEDGIRDLIVTGVQTCALPICLKGSFIRAFRANLFPQDVRPPLGPCSAQSWFTEYPHGEGIYMIDSKTRPENRSEERRVGKECRSRWSPYH